MSPIQIYSTAIQKDIIQQSTINWKRKSYSALFGVGGCLADINLNVKMMEWPLSKTMKNKSKYIKDVQLPVGFTGAAPLT